MMIHSAKKQGNKKSGGEGGGGRGLDKKRGNQHRLDLHKIGR